VRKKRQRPTLAALVGLSLLGPTPSFAQMSTSGLTGLLEMPDARMEQDGLLRAGLHLGKPYQNALISVQGLPFLEVSGRYRRVDGVSGGLGASFGAFKDKSIAFKLRLIEEGAFGQAWIPQLAYGREDLFGTKVYPSEFLVASKSLGDLDLTLGYGRQRIDGMFGGIHYRPSAFKRWYGLVEYDATAYRTDFGAVDAGLSDRKTGHVNAAIGYQSDWWGIQVGSSYNKPSVLVQLRAPTNQREWAPWVAEAPAYQPLNTRPTTAEWDSNPDWAQTLRIRMDREGFRDVGLKYDGSVMRVAFSSTRHLLASRAVARAARLVLAHTPVEAKGIELTPMINGMATKTYVFSRLDVLADFFAGTATLATLQQHTQLNAADASTQPGPLDDATLEALVYAQREDLPVATRIAAGAGNLAIDDARGNTLGLSPYTRIFLNDPSGAFKYELGLQLGGRYEFTRSTTLEGNLRGRIAETVTDVKQPSNSLLPRVRTDVAEYFRGANVKLDRLQLNQFWQPAANWYARASGGLYEEMFGGAGAQVMYVAPSGRWAADVMSDWLRQRDFKGTGFRDYSTVTGYVSGHVRLPYDMLATVRAGRFLAKDEGARFELKRRFASGITMGFWYTHTNGRDITNPGTPEKPYKDKGIFVSMPLNLMLTRDSAAVATFALSPWTRDVGQMVNQSADLIGMFERSMLYNLHGKEALRGFTDAPADAEAK
jgi:hypothetical protein